MLVGSAFTHWVQNSLTLFTFTPKTVLVKLLDGDDSIIAAWSLSNAYPVSLKMSDFKAMDNSLAIETLELTYDYFQQTQ
jgi:phage tail-like protein